MQVRCQQPSLRCFIEWVQCYQDNTDWQGNVLDIYKRIVVKIIVCNIFDISFSKLLKPIEMPQKSCTSCIISYIYLLFRPITFGTIFGQTFLPHAGQREKYCILHSITFVTFLIWNLGWYACNRSFEDFFQIDIPSKILFYNLARKYVDFITFSVQRSMLKHLKYFCLIFHTLSEQ